MEDGQPASLGLRIISFLFSLPFLAVLAIPTYYFKAEIIPYLLNDYIREGLWPPLGELLIYSFVFAFLGYMWVGCIYIFVGSVICLFINPKSKEWCSRDSQTS